MYNDNGKVDVGAIAKKHGGKHKGDAGFKTESFPFQECKTSFGDPQ